MKVRELAAWLLVAALVLAGVGGLSLALTGTPVERVVLHYADGSVQEFVPAGGPSSPTPTQPAGPPTATPIPTSTPLPPSPTPSTTPSATQGAPTPTQELATWTPLPPSPTPSKCYVKNVDYTINLRAEPRTTAQIVEHVQRGTVPELLAVQHGAQGYGYLWARTFVNGVGGWFVIRRYSDWWVYSIGAETQACVDLDGWPDGELPPLISPNPPTPTPPPITRRTALLWHDVPGGNMWEMQQSWQVLNAKGIPFGVKAVNDPAACNAAQAAGGICIFRSVHPADCPDVTNHDPKREAYLYMLSVAPYYNQNIKPDYIELVNECNMDNLTWWRDFMLEAVHLQQAWNWPPLAMPSLIPGAGDSTLIEPLVPALRALRDAGGCFSSHDYGIYNSHLVAPDGSCDVWTSCRHRLIRAALDRYGLQDLEICVTEAARGSGNETVDVQDFARWYDTVSRDAGLHSVSLWTAGLAGAWPNANLNGYMVQIAQAVQ